MKRWKKALIIIGSILLVIILAAVGLWFYLFGGIKHVELDINELGIEEITPWEVEAATVAETTEEPAEETEEVESETEKDDSETEQYTETENLTTEMSETETVQETTTVLETTTAAETTTEAVKRPIVNIAIYGMSVSEVGGIDTDRSDMNLIASIDLDNNRVCLTSILRDSKVPIEGHDPQKINAAYKYGGPTLAIKTLNKNFHLNIANFITVDFEDLIEIVDSFGGVEIELTEKEAGVIPGTTPGKNLLDGEKALKYASIRYIDSDFHRASRQQTILMALLSKIKGMPKTEYPSVVNKLMSCIETSLDIDDIWNIINSLDVSTMKVVTNTIPDYKYEEGLWGGIDETGSWVYVYDIEEAAKRLHRIIYEGSQDGADPKKVQEETK